MRATFFSNCLNFFDSPTRSARSMMDIEATVARALGPGRGALLRHSGLLRVLDGRIAFLPQLDLELRQRGDLPRDLGELLLDARPPLVIDRDAVAALHLDAHSPSWISPRPR